MICSQLDQFLCLSSALLGVNKFYFVSKAPKNPVCKMTETMVENNVKVKSASGPSAGVYPGSVA